MLGICGQVRYALDCRAACADDGYLFVAQPVKVGVIRAAARIVIVPATGVEHLALKVFKPRSAGELGTVQTAWGRDHIAGAHFVAAVGGDHPTGHVVIPSHLLDPSAEAGAGTQVKLLRDLLGNIKNFVGVGVTFLGCVAELVEQRQIAVRLDVALGTGIAVPVPGATEVTRLLDNTQVRNTLFPQTRGTEHATETGTDDQHIDFVSQRCALNLPLHKWVSEQVIEALSSAAILIAVIRA